LGSDVDDHGTEDFFLPFFLEFENSNWNSGIAKIRYVLVQTVPYVRGAGSRAEATRYWY
jgi:hypothetical protein